MKPVPFLPAAREEFLAAAHHYDTAAPGLGDDFIAAVERAVARIAALPEHGSPHLMGTRRVVLRRFPLALSTFSSPRPCWLLQSRITAGGPGTGGTVCDRFLALA